MRKDLGRYFDIPLLTPCFELLTVDVRIYGTNTLLLHQSTSASLLHYNFSFYTKSKWLGFEFTAEY